MCYLLLVVETGTRVAPLHGRGISQRPCAPGRWSCFFGAQDVTVSDSLGALASSYLSRSTTHVHQALVKPTTVHVARLLSALLLSNVSARASSSGSESSASVRTSSVRRVSSAAPVDYGAFRGPL